MAYKIPRLVTELWQPCRYKVLFGGRGGGKSIAIADALLLEGARSKQLIACFREYQNKLDESVYALLVERINHYCLNAFYKVANTEIVGANGTRFIFLGLARNINGIQSLQGITRAWVEEAQTISARSIDVLVPTIRATNSEIWFSFNPQFEDDPVYSQFAMSTSPDVRKWCVNWRDNPFFPEVLEKERLRKFYNDPEGYANVWEGALITNSKASIFKDHYKVEDFTPTAEWGYPLYGMDFGYSNDPTTLVKCYLYNDTIYIEKSAGKINLDINDIPRYFFNEFGEDLSRTSISADCSQPMTIEYLRTHGLSGIHACQKWQGSIIDGISWLKSFGKMVVHSRATGVIENLRLYSNKVDLRNDKVLNDPKDANNDYIDALRYAFDRIIKTNGSYWHLFDKIGDDFNEVF